MGTHERTILETERLVVRELREADLDFVAEMLGDAEVMRYWPAPHSRDESRAWIERQCTRYERDGCGYWLAVDRHLGQPVGQVGIIMSDVHDEPEPGVGYIIHQPFWRRGYAFEGARACIDHAFNSLSAQHVIAPVRPENAPSAALAEKLGMTIRETVPYHGFVHHIYDMGRPT